MPFCDQTLDVAIGAAAGLFACQRRIFPAWTPVSRR